MPNYRRAFVPGGCWFFTANLLDRRSTLLADKIEELRLGAASKRQQEAERIRRQKRRRSRRAKEKMLSDKRARGETKAARRSPSAEE